MATVARLCMMLLLLTCVTYSVCKHTHKQKKLSRTEVKAILCAYKRTLFMINTDRMRRKNGTDTSIAAKTVITPGVLGGRDSDLSSLVNPAALINAIHTCDRHVDVAKLLRVGVKSHMQPILKKLGHCPYKLESPCPLVATMKYRRADGSCNNLVHSLWGSSNIPLIRRLPPGYEAGDKPRRHGVGNITLPSARLISTTVHTATTQPSVAPVTSFYTAFGQVISHDMANTPGSKGDRGVPISCCKTTKRHDKCFNIDIPKYDPFFAQYKTTCMGFARSAEGTDLQCKKGVRQQISLATSFIDCSTVYSDGTKKFDKLVDRDTGMMRVSPTDLTPVCMHQNAKARAMGINLFCAGDPKVSESPQLYSTNLLFNRLHNKIVTELARVNPNWGGLQLYQETRRMVIAYMQHVVYNEYLPATLSDETIVHYNLRSLSSGYFTGYDSSVDPTIYNVVATAAMRFGHSMLNEDHAYAFRNWTLDQTERLLLKRSFFKPLSYLVREMDINRGQIVTPSEVCDRKFVQGMSNHLFETKPGNGKDIVSLNIQRGRDHGLLPYVEWRKAFGLHAPNDWSPASFPNHTSGDVDLFKKVYASPLDIDLYSGGVSETPESGKTVGPLFGKIIGAQFDRLKRGDRFWYETGANPQRFTVDQLQEIRKITLAQIICLCDSVDDVQANPLLLHDEMTNPRVACTGMAKVNFTKWAE